MYHSPSRSACYPAHLDLGMYRFLPGFNAEAVAELTYSVSIQSIVT